MIFMMNKIHKYKKNNFLNFKLMEYRKNVVRSKLLDV